MSEPAKLAEQMTYKVDYSPEANAQIVAIYRYLSAQASPVIAHRFVLSIIERCEGFGGLPHQGTKRDEIRPGLRTLGFRRRVTIAFTVNAAAVTILGIFYGGQDYETALQNNEDV